jgi:hypothetical protein
MAPAGREGGRNGDGASTPRSYEVTIRPTGRCSGGSPAGRRIPTRTRGQHRNGSGRRGRTLRPHHHRTETSDRARDQVFLRVRSTCSASGVTMGSGPSDRARHLFREHCLGTPEPMSHLRMGGMHRRIMGDRRQSHQPRRKPAGHDADRNKCALQPSGTRRRGFSGSVLEPVRRPRLGARLGQRTAVETSRCQVAELKGHS